jgi:PAS domain S-box-containing protein
MTFATWQISVAPAKGRFPLLLLSLLTVIVFIFSIISLMSGWQTIFQNLFYFPILLACVYYLRRGFVFSVILACSYFILMAIFSQDPVVLQGALIRVLIFILVAGVITHLSIIRIRAEGALKESEAFNRGLVENMPNLVVVYDHDRKIRYVNPATTALLGYSVEEIVGTDIMTYVDPLRQDEIAAVTQELFSANREKSLEIDLISKEGHHLTVILKGAPLHFYSQPVVLALFADITGHKRAEEALRESEQFTREIIQNAKEGIVVYDRDFNYLIWNPFMESHTGFSASETLGKNAFDLFPHLREQKIDILLQQALAGETIRSPDTPYHIPQTEKSGWVSGIYSPHYNARGEIIGVVGIIRDITERKRAEKALEESERKYRSIFNNFPDVYYQTDLNGIITILSPSLKRLSGWEPEELIGHSTVELYPFPEQRGDLLEALSRSGDVNGYEITLRLKDGRHIQTSISCHLIYDEGKLVGLEGSIRDIDEKKTMENALRESEARLHSIVKGSPMLQFVVDKDHRVVSWNRAIEEYSGIKEAEVLDTKDQWKAFYDKERPVLADLLVDEKVESLPEWYQGKIQKSRLVEGAYEVTDFFPKMGVSGKWLYFTAAPIRDVNGAIIGAVETLEDITERKIAEEALVLASRKLNLLSGITRHDIRNQLLALSGYLEISKRSLGDPVRTSDFIAKEEKIADTIARQITFTKDYEDMGVKAPTWQNVSMTVRNVIAHLPMRGISVDTGDPHLEMLADPLLEKVFYNLIDNALQYGGEKMTAIRITNHDDNGNFVIAVEDNGDGICADDKKKLFTKGFGKHTGLGLYLSREILSITGITITENGEPGKGARFEITVPNGTWRFTTMHQ